MKKDAEAHAEEDKKKRELIEVRNMADTMVYTTEKMMKEIDEKKVIVSDDEKKKVNDALAKVKEVKDKDDIEAIKKASEELSTAAQAVGMKLYQSAQQPGAGNKEQGTSSEKQNDPSAGTQGKKDGGEAVEGEVVDDKS